MASTTTFFACPTGAPAAQGSLHGGPASLGRHHGSRTLAARKSARHAEGFQERLQRMPELMENIHPTGPGNLGYAERGIVAVVNPDRLRRILSRMLDENEFLGPMASALSPNITTDHPYCPLRERPGIQGELSSG